MAGTKIYARPHGAQDLDIAEVLRDQARRRLTPEEAASELSVSTMTLRRYLADSGGRVMVERYIYMPD